VDHVETLSLIAELALGLAGFTGVAGTFGGRDRDYSPADQARIESIFMLTGSVLAGSLASLTLLSAGFPNAASYGWASLIAGAICFRPLYIALTRGVSLAKDPEMSTSSLIVIASLVIILSSLGFNIGNFLLWKNAWPLLAASSLQLAWALFLFARILTQRN
jgi:hypothetical protein